MSFGVHELNAEFVVVVFGGIAAIVGHARELHTFFVVIFECQVKYAALNPSTEVSFGEERHVEFVVACWRLNANHGALFVVVNIVAVRSKRFEGCELEITVSCSAPSPVEVESVVVGIITVAKECVTVGVVATRVAHRAVVNHFVVDDFFPLAVGEVAAVAI